jgi:type I restriction enzyme M protein
MQWIAPSEKDATNDALEKRLWEAADQLRANSGLTAAQYSQPVLGLIFLRFAEARFEKIRKLLEERTPAPLRATRLADPNAYQAESVLYMAPEARYQRLLTLPEGAALGRELNEAMRAIERDNPQLSGVLSKTYEIFDSRTLVELLKLISSIPTSGEGDTFGRVYEYFLGTFAMAEGQLGGEFYTPTSLVRLLVEILEPFHGRVLDLRVGRYVCPECAVRATTPQESFRRTQHPWAGTGRSNGAVGAAEPGCARARGPDPAGEFLLRGSLERREVRFFAGKSTFQRRRSR